MANAGAAWVDDGPRRAWWLAAVAITVVERAATFAYFIPTMVRPSRGAHGSEADVRAGRAPDLLGRKTYEIFAAYWPYYDEGAPHGAIARLFNDIKKYTVSRSGEVDPGWAGSVLLRDIADREAPEAGRRPEPGRPGQYRGGPRAARE